MDAGLTLTVSSAENVERIGQVEAREILVGLAAAGVFAAIVVLSYLGALGDVSGGADSYRIFAPFNRIDGLHVGDEVELAGIPVGQVDSLELDSDFRARVALRIDDDVRVPTDTSVAIHTDGLFGRKFVVLEPGGSEDMVSEGGVLIFTQDSLIVSELLDLIIAEGRARARAAGEEDPH
ncbi:MAG: MCE family protein [Rhodospirillales bacterium]|nr:MCE family protein [Rhodospirillales bacterium]